MMGAILNGRAMAGLVSGNPKTIKANPVLTVAGAYSAGDYVGTSAAAMTLAGAADLPYGGGWIVSAVLTDYALQSKAFELWLFDAAPAGIPADNAAFTLTDNSAFVGVIPFSTWYANALFSVSQAVFDPIQFTCTGAGVKDLYGVLVTRGAPTLTSLDLWLRLGIMKSR